MEALGLFGLYVACKHIDEEHMLTYMNACGSTSAINTHRKLMELNRMQLPQLPNSDVWQIIKMYRRH